MNNGHRSKSSRFLVGKDSHGHWVVQDRTGLCGGLFIGHAEALKFAMRASGNSPQAVITVPGLLELDMSRKSSRRRSAANIEYLNSEIRSQNLYSCSCSS